MRCRECNYALWGLTARTCPECGAAFKPSDFEFVPNSVKYLCPHCGQSYYGTDEKGHLTPREFDCVTCGGRCVMDEMALTPGDGVPEMLTQPVVVPWHNKERNRFVRWLYTVGWSLGTPQRLMRAMLQRPTDSGASVFVLLNFLITALVAGSPALLFSVLFFGGMGATPNDLLYVLVASLVVLVGFWVLMFLWALLSYLLLLTTGGAARGLGTMMRVVYWSSGALVLSAIPCLSFYSWPVTVIWWAVSATLMTIEAHKAHPLRATLCVGGLPLLAAAGAIVWAVVSLTAFTSAVMSSRGASVEIATSDVTRTLLSEMQTSGAPDHPLRLVSNSGLGLYNLIVIHPAAPRHFPRHIDLGTMSIDMFAQEIATRQEEVIAAVLSANASELPAQRLGDFVFLSHGVDINAADPALWLVACAPESAVGAAPSAWDTIWIVVASADGTTERIEPADFNERLREQNELRVNAGLPPIPDPRRVTFTPGVAASAPSPP